MSIFSQADPARFPYKSGFNLSYEKDTDIEIGKLNILNAEFICPGDIVHVSENILLRFQAQIAPFFTPLTATIRNWFIPLRLIEENTEWIITGSKNGKVIKENGEEVELPKFDKLFDYENSDVSGAYKVKIGGVVEQLFGLPTKRADGTTDLDYTNVADSRCIPALYWVKAYCRMWFDYYRDENLFDYDDFDDWWTAILAEGKIGQLDLLPVNWKKDYLTSMLYSQQKGTAPVLNPFLNNPQLSLPVTTIAEAWPDESNVPYYQWLGIPEYAGKNIAIVDAKDEVPPPTEIKYTNSSNFPSNMGPKPGTPPYFNTQLLGIDKSQITNLQGGFNVAELRLLFAQQKIFERLMRCGSRYVEYLMSNFGIAPADETLQRVQYLGGFKQAVVTSEVLQTGTDSSNPVGTQRGHSISAGGNSLGKHFFKEFGIMLTTLSVMPKAVYAQGINRKYALTERFDFPNPSFQFLSEDEVLNGEAFFDIDQVDGAYQNDKTMGFQEMYAWLKSNRDMVIGNLRGSEKYWTMLRWFSSRPNLNEQFLTSVADSTNFSVPFAVTDKPPIIMRAGNVVHMWRNFAKFGTPGLMDHY